MKGPLKSQHKTAYYSSYTPLLHPRKTAVTAVLMFFCFVCSIFYGYSLVSANPWDEPEDTLQEQPTHEPTQGPTQAPTLPFDEPPFFAPTDPPIDISPEFPGGQFAEIPMFPNIGFNKDYWYEYTNGLTDDPQITKPATAQQIKVACVGDSITYGYGIEDWPNNNYPTQLQELLTDIYHVQNFGVSGSCVQATGNKAYIDQPAYVGSLDYEADILVFMMGTNDSKEVNWEDAETFKIALNELLDSYEGAKVILCTPAKSFFVDEPVDRTEDASEETHPEEDETGETHPEEDETLESEDGEDPEEMLTTSFDIQPEIVEQIAVIVREVAQERGCMLLDIYTLTESNPQWFEEDGIHPNSEGADAIADAVCHAIQQISITK